MPTNHGTSQKINALITKNINDSLTAIPCGSSWHVLHQMIFVHKTFPQNLYKKSLHLNFQSIT